LEANVSKSYLTRNVISESAAIQSVSHAAAGAVVSFSGLVRDHNEGRTVTRLDYEAYDAMAEKELALIVHELETEFAFARCYVAHRLGELQIGDAAVVCAASAPHRNEAFLICRELLDRVKSRVPIWKREWGPDGAVWVGWEDARCSGEHRHASADSSDHRSK
jgi:molybdopterin synthase catalytic subunit